LDFSLDVREEIGERCVIQFDPFAAVECSGSDPDFTSEIRESFTLQLEQSQPLSDHLLLAAEMSEKTARGLPICVRSEIIVARSLGSV
jgi:hypothetical protein